MWNKGIVENNVVRIDIAVKHIVMIKTKKRMENSKSDDLPVVKRELIWGSEELGKWL
jgi:hypothetical protein